jgi:hypothetical protein
VLSSASNNVSTRTPLVKLSADADTAGRRAYTLDIPEGLRKLICQEKDSWERNNRLDENS